MIKLKHVVSDVTISDIEMVEGEFTVGRNDGNSLQLNDGMVSGNHALITIKVDDCFPEVFDITIKDLGSTNGTYVNSAPITESKIRHGDSIRFGSHEFRVFDDQSTTGTRTEYHVPED